MKRYKSILKPMSFLIDLAKSHGFDEDETDKICPMCSNSIKIKANICKHCKNEFDYSEIEKEMRRKIDIFLSTKNVKPTYEGVSVNWSFFKKKNQSDYFKSHYKAVGASLQKK